MSAGKSQKTAGFVLKSLAYGESDLIITFYSRDFGKISGIAKGAKRSRKRFANVFEPFSQIALIFSRKSRDTLALIESCEIIDHYAAIRADLEKTLTASYFIELADAFSPEGKANDRLFVLLADFLDWLAGKTRRMRRFAFSKCVFCRSRDSSPRWAPACAAGSPSPTAKFTTFIRRKAASPAPPAPGRKDTISPSPRAPSARCFWARTWTWKK
jgi:DNA repair protein RecO (recombination protein O)